MNRLRIHGPVTVALVSVGILDAYPVEQFGPALDKPVKQDEVGEKP